MHDSSADTVKPFSQTELVVFQLRDFLSERFKSNYDLTMFEPKSDDTLSLDEAELAEVLCIKPLTV